MATNWKVSDALITAVKGFEGLSLKAYKDSVGVVTIGYGHVRGVKMGMTITPQQAEKYLRDDLTFTGKFVNKLGDCKSLTQFEAIVDFAYNLGVKAYHDSTLRRVILAGGREDEIRYQFMRWVHAGGKTLPGLVKRRAWEADHFFGKR